MDFKILPFLILIFCTLPTIGQVSIPKEVTASKGEYEDAIILKWKGKSTGTYLIYHSKTGKNLVKIGETIGMQHTHSGENLVGGKANYYAVKHKKGNLESAFSPIVVGYTAAFAFLETPIPSFPTLSDTPFSKEDSIIFQWETVADATHYQIQISQNPDSWTLSSGFSNTIHKERLSNNQFSWTAFNLAEGNYYWTVRAILELGTPQDTGSYYSKPAVFSIDGELLGSAEIPDIQIQNLQISDSISKGQDFPIALTFQSNHLKTVSNYNIAFFLSTDTDFDIKGKKPFAVQSFRINSLATENKTTVLKIPTIVKSGRLYLVGVPVYKGKYLVEKRIIKEIEVK